MQTVERWATRSDAWTQSDDERLASLVLQHIRTGSTQLRAFEDAANELGRTAAACGYRWNGVVRKHYRKSIDQAKHERKRAQKASADHGIQSTATTTPLAERVETTSSSESMRDVIKFLQTYDEQYQKLVAHMVQLENDKATLTNRIQALEARLPVAPERQQPTDVAAITPQQLEEDSKTLFAIMERARKLLDTDTSRLKSE